MRRGIKLEIINEGDAPVYMKYDGQYLPQPAFLRLELTGKEPRLYADYSGETPMNVHNNTVEWSIEANTSRQSLLDISKNEEFQSLLIQIVEGHEKGYFNDDAALVEELETVLENELECIDVWPAKDYIESCSYSLIDIPAGGIEELAKDTELYAKLYADAAILGDIREALEEYFKELIEREEEEEEE